MAATEMEERVARALAVADGVDPNAASLVGMKTMRCWQARLPQARAAIQAMREPTDQMYEAGCAAFSEEPSESYRAMIYAASPTQKDDER